MPARPPKGTETALASAVQAVDFLLSRSYQALAIMPCVRGNAPVPIVAWPAHVSVPE